MLDPMDVQRTLGIRYTLIVVELPKSIKNSRHPIFFRGKKFSQHNDPCEISWRKATELGVTDKYQWFCAFRLPAKERERQLLAMEHLLARQAVLRP